MDRPADSAPCPAPDPGSALRGAPTVPMLHFAVTKKARRAAGARRPASCPTLEVTVQRPAARTPLGCRRYSSVLDRNVLLADAL